MRNLVAVASVVVLCLAGANHAEATPQPLPGNNDACASAKTTVDFEECQNVQLEMATKDLDDLTARIEAHLRGDGATHHAFDAAQAAWRTDLKRTCDDMVFTQYGQGSARLTEPLRCAVAMTEQRSALLRNLFYVKLND